jgi:ribosomal protein L36
MNKTCDNCQHMRPGKIMIYCKLYRTFKTAVPCEDHRLKKDSQ